MPNPLEFDAANANSAAADQTHHNLLSDTYNHVKGTWKDVLTGNASGGQYLEAAGELAAAGALAYGAIRGGSGLTSLLKGGESGGALAVSKYLAGTELAAGKDLLGTVKALDGAQQIVGTAVPDLTLGREAVGKLVPHLTEEQLTKMVTDLKLFPAADIQSMLHMQVTR